MNDLPTDTNNWFKEGISRTKHPLTIISLGSISS